MTTPVKLVLRAFHDADEAGEPLWGKLVMARTGLGSGSVYPILRRLEGAGWISGEWEAAVTPGQGRPRRRFLCLTDAGRAEIRARALLGK